MFFYKTGVLRKLTKTVALHYEVVFLIWREKKPQFLHTSKYYDFYIGINNAAVFLVVVMFI